MRGSAALAHHQWHLFPGIADAGAVVQYSHPDLSLFVLLKNRAVVLSGRKGQPLFVWMPLDREEEMWYRYSEVRND